MEGRNRSVREVLAELNSVIPTIKDDTTAWILASWLARLEDANAKDMQTTASLRQAVLLLLQDDPTLGDIDDAKILAGLK